MGKNKFGYLGLGDNNSKNRPTLLVVDNNIIKAKSVSCGDHYTIMILINEY
jgi:alpha-tubulin suppressor-like RCC1 family protein